MGITIMKASLLLTLIVSNASHYHPGTMERVAAKRGLPQVNCMVASLDYAVGTWLRVRSLTTGLSRTCRVTDIVAKADRVAHVRKNIHIEIGYRNIGSLCGLRYYGEEPPSRCKVAISLLRSR